MYRASRQPTKALAKRWVSEIESRIARGQVGIEESDDAPGFKALFSREPSSLRWRMLDEVSAAVGHSSPVVTKRFDDHYVRRTFSPKLRAGLGLVTKQQGGKLVPMRKPA